jgi:hypothetical protein
MSNVRKQSQRAALLAEAHALLADFSKSSPAKRGKIMQIDEAEAA